MSLILTSRIISGVVIVEIAGRLCFLDVTLHARINEWLESGRRAFILDLANVSYIDSFGLGQLIIIWTSIKNRGGHMILLRPTDHVQTLFQITRLNTVFEIAAEEADAVGRLETNVCEIDLQAVSVNSTLS